MSKPEDGYGYKDNINIVCPNGEGLIPIRRSIALGRKSLRKYVPIPIRFNCETCSHRQDLTGGDQVNEYIPTIMSITLLNGARIFLKCNRELSMIDIINRPSISKQPNQNHVYLRGERSG